jgi:hypothetical protein
MAAPAISPNLAFQEGISNFSFSLYGAIERSGNLANNLLATDNVTPVFALDSILVFNVLYPMCTSLTIPVVNIDDKI